MDALTTSLAIGFLIGLFCVWVTSFLNDRYIQREKFLSRLILKRVRKE